MISARWKRWLKEVSHPSREELLAYLDGELEARRTRTVQQHLEQCWTCRQEVERVRKTVGAFVEYRLRRGALHENQPPHQWTKFPFLLAQASSRGRSGGQPHSFSALRWTRAAAAAACGLIVLVVWIRLASVSTVSAKEILARVDAAERREGPEAGRPLLRQTLRVVRRSAGGAAQTAESVVVWQDLAAGEPLAAGSGPSTQGAGLLPPPWRNEPLLSAAAFDRWRRSLVSRREDVRSIGLPDGRPGFRIEVQNLGLGSKDGILENALLVRSDIWKPVSQHVRLRSGGEELLFDVVRESYAFLSREKPVPPAETAGAKRRLAPLAALPIPAAPDSHADAPGLLRAEVEARFALHRLNACVDDSIEVATESGAIVVRGATGTNERRNEIAAALARIGAVRLEVEAAETLAARLPAAETAELPDGEQLAEQVASAVLPLRDRLVAYLKRERPEADLARAAAGVADSAVTASSAAVAHAGALKRLADRFGEEEISRMEPASCWLLETMARSHLEQLREARCHLEDIVSPLLNRPSLDAAGGAQPTPAGWREASAGLFENSRAVDSLIRQLFAPSAALQQPVDPALDRLWALLAGAEPRFIQIESYLAEELSGVHAAGKGRPPLPRPLGKEH